ncbi:Serine/threonine-protein kinase ark1 [Auxenochlorella protothecoides]|uniref:Serine/threonine-protein kinase ark1 n=1 Tax=Auxenochlorella protothecoides TaxID=3075 RepID=A0A087SCH2_AUXPR|nr:Serine/threonine-protein kinase ark1 [Auxenochlorella protothecoides]KFM23426.1 Serine/threonine-protein kinase ark1 [Auxenochlorella protothecoides]RMZ55156.1 hypothetical protein APUTEX25_005434 [Auxenochlorella protothecoides]|eukprot:RMZ55156.1 hypothetical protein APUTEX25_005434 [Auxenochlorella protothecoides]
MKLAETPWCPPGLRRSNWAISNFKVDKLLGEGSLSTVISATCRTSNQRVAIKTYHKDRLIGVFGRQVAREISIHAALNHPSIVPLYATFEDADGIYLVQELAAQGDLYGELAARGGFMHEKEVVQQVLVPLLNALQYLHEKGVMHRDIKPENILIVKLTVSSTPVMPTGANYTLAVDCWCVGVLAYELLIGGPPFEAPSKEATYTRIQKAEPFLPRHLSHAAKAFLGAALQREPSQRPSPSAMLRDPWITGLQEGHLARAGAATPAPAPAQDQSRSQPDDGAVAAASPTPPSSEAPSTAAPACVPLEGREDGADLIPAARRPGGATVILAPAGTKVRAGIAAEGPGKPLQALRKKLSGCCKAGREVRAEPRSSIAMVNTASGTATKQSFLMAFGKKLNMGISRKTG